LSPLNFSDNECATRLLYEKFHFISCFYLIQYSGIFYLKYHRHCRHLKMLDFPMFNRDFLRFFMGSSQKTENKAR